MANCYACKAEIVFDAEHIGRNGKKIPLDPFTKQPHDCPMREKRELSEPLPARPVDYSKLEEKDDHGNESYSSIKTQVATASDSNAISPKEYVEKLGYVDHTTAAKGIPQFQVFTNRNADFLTAEGNRWIKEHPDYNVKLIGQLQFDNGTFAIALYYEETA